MIMEIINQNYYILCVICNIKNITEEKYLWYIVQDAKSVTVDNTELFFRVETNSEGDKIYNLIDALTGMMLSWGFSEEEAIDKFKSHFEKLSDYQKTQINKHGLSPRYTKNYSYEISGVWPTINFI